MLMQLDHQYSFNALLASKHHNRMKLGHCMDACVSECVPHYLKLLLLLLPHYPCRIWTTFLVLITQSVSVPQEASLLAIRSSFSLSPCLSPSYLMESFLSTLPPYVHDFLNKHPPTDVFNVLRELVCFAVLYSNDRERIAAKTKELLDQGADVVSKDIDNSSMGGQNAIATSNDSDSITTTTTAASKSSNTAATKGDDDDDDGNKTTEKKHDVNKAVDKVSCLAMCVHRCQTNVVMENRWYRMKSM